jgi:succinylglutamate desuccinylase
MAIASSCNINRSSQKSIPSGKKDLVYCVRFVANQPPGEKHDVLFRTENMPTETDFPRYLGRYGTPGKGPLLVAIGGLHGNEPTGCWALQTTLSWLRNTQPSFQGEFVALAGNRRALAQGQRYIDTDLNRLWTQDNINAIDAGQIDISIAEHNEQVELLSICRELTQQRSEPATFLDLHTSSSPSAPFGIVGQQQVNRAFANDLGLPIPLVFGLDAQFDGPMLKYIGSHGHRTLAFEAGQHHDPNSVGLHQAIILTLLLVNGHITVEDLPKTEGLFQEFIHLLGDVPPFLEVFYRHAITAEDEFVMKPGFDNFSPVQQGDTLAQERSGPVLAPETSHVLLPLYQKQGNDGFFLARQIQAIPHNI